MTTLSITTQSLSSRKQVSHFQEIWLSARNNPTLVIGVILTLLFTIAIVIGPLLLKYDPLRQDLINARALPSSVHLFGTDELGRDELTRILYGGRITLMISVYTLIVALIIGVTIGLATGYFGGAVDTVFMRAIEVQLSIPALILSMVIIGVLGVGTNSLVIAMAVSSYPGFARLTRAVTLSVREEEYVSAARSIGASNSRIVLRHIFPNILPHILTLTTISLGRVVLSASSLGFLGFGVEPGTPELGMMVAEARSVFRAFPHLLLFPAATIFLLVLALNLTGDGIRDLVDPHLRKGKGGKI